MIKKNIKFAIVGLAWGILYLSSCKSTKNSNLETPIKQFNTRIQESMPKTDSLNYMKVGFYTFDCIEHFDFKGSTVKAGKGYETTTKSFIGVMIKNYYQNKSRISEYLTYTNYGNDDTVRFSFADHFKIAYRISKYNEFNWQEDSIISKVARVDTLPLRFEDSLRFSYGGHNYSIYRFSGRMSDSICATFFISSFYGIFKIYVPEEYLSYQLDVYSIDQDFEIYMAHLYYLFHNPIFHSRCDDGPLWLFKDYYLKSNKPRCNSYKWPDN